MALLFTQLAADPLNGANLNPINPAVWTTQSVPGAPNPQILNHVCITTDPVKLYTSTEYTGTTFPSDQYIQVTGHFTAIPGDFNYIILKLRNVFTPSVKQYFAQITPNSHIFPTLQIGSFIGGVQNIFLQNSTHSFFDGDVYIFAVLGNTVFFYQNGVLLERVATDNTLSSGTVAFEIDDTTLVTDVGVTLFSGGAVAGPDTIFTSQPFSDPQSNPLANGSLTFDLSQPSKVTISGGSIVPMRVPVTLTSAGLIPANTLLWGNDQLTPTGTTYRLRVYNSNGLLVGDWGQLTIAGTSPIDISQLTPH